MKRRFRNCRGKLSLSVANPLYSEIVLGRLKLVCTRVDLVISITHLSKLILCLITTSANTSRDKRKIKVKMDNLYGLLFIQLISPTTQHCVARFEKINNELSRVFFQNELKQPRKNSIVSHVTLHSLLMFQHILWTRVEVLLSSVQSVTSVQEVMTYS